MPTALSFTSGDPQGIISPFLAPTLNTTDASQTISVGGQMRLGPFNQSINPIVLIGGTFTNQTVPGSGSSYQSVFANKTTGVVTASTSATTFPAAATTQVLLFTQVLPSGTTTDTRYQGGWTPAIQW